MSSEQERIDKVGKRKRTFFNAVFNCTQADVSSSTYDGVAIANGNQIHYLRIGIQFFALLPITRA